MKRSIKIAIAVAAVAACIVGLSVIRPIRTSEAPALAQVSANNYRCAPSQFYGRTDGLCVATSDYTPHLFINGTDIAAFDTTGALQMDGDLTVTGGKLTYGNGATIDNETNGALTFAEASEDLTCTFTGNTLTWTSSTGVTVNDWQIATTVADALTLSDKITLSDGLTIDQSANNVLSIAENSEDLEITFSSNTLTASSTTGVDTLSLGAIGLEGPVVASSAFRIRFCGNGPDGATTTYIGPVLPEFDVVDATGGAQDPVDLSFGGAFCDTLDNTTEGTADRVFHAGWALKPIAISCVGLCTGTSAANDAIVFQLRDDTASVAGMTCTTAALGGDATPAQCSARDATPATIAAGSAIAVSVTMTNDDCNDAGDDFECLLTVTF